MAKLDHLLGVIGQLYDAAQDSELWPGASAAIAQHFDSPSTMIQLRDPARPSPLLSVTDNFSPETLIAYRDHYWRQDVFAEQAQRIGVRRLLDNDNMIPDKELERTEFYCDWMRKTETFFIAGLGVPVGAQSIAYLGIHRPRPSGRYSSDEKRRLQLLMPHFERAIQLHERLAEAALGTQASLEGLSRTATAALIVGRDLRILFHNGAAEFLLRQGDGIRQSNHRLSTRHAHSADLLRSLVSGAANAAAGQPGTAGGNLAVRREGRLPLTLFIAPLRPARARMGAAEPAAIVLVRDPETLTLNAAVLQSLFGLTPAEAALAAKLADGASLEEIAVIFGISMNTARTQLKSVFSKTGTSRQAQLVALILRSVASFAKQVIT